MANLNNSSHKEQSYACEIIPTYKKTPFKKHKIKTARVAFNFIRKIIPKEVIPHYEVFGALFLDDFSCLIGYNILTKGGITHTMVDIRLLFQNALICNATKIIIFHNHPAGNVQPSQRDKEMTERIRQAGELMDIKLLDSIIITDHYSITMLGKETYEKE